MLRRLIAACLFVAVSTLALAGLEVGATPARGPGGIMSSELVVDGGRTPTGTSTGRRSQRPPRTRETDEEPEDLVVARSLAEVEDLRPLWEELQGPQLTSDIDFFQTYLRQAPGVVRPHVVVVGENGGTPTIVAGRIEIADMALKLGYTTAFSTRLRTLTVAYGGVLGPVDERRAALVVSGLKRSLEPEDADLVRLRMLEPGSALHTAAAVGTSRLRRERNGGPTVHWSTSVARPLDEYLASRKKKVRWQARKDLSTLAETYGDALEVRVFRSPAELDELLRDSERVHRTTYQNALGVGLSTGEPHRSLTELALERGWFRGYVLYLHGEPVAFWHGNAYRGVFGLGPTGFDPAYSPDRPGGYLLMRLIEDLCADGSVHTLDFGFGDAIYKRQLGDTQRLEEDVAEFAPTAKAVSLNVARTALHGLTGAAKAVLARSGRLTSLKRRWRGRLAGGNGG
ncbi:MAG TPA: GNAT family N-acetyltransferase [Gaiellaceae bacterium]|nr:GNAT family N-acetyltransferase [Gaiellaceae bacterium]